jgi:hypothetical protein
VPYSSRPEAIDEEVLQALLGLDAADPRPQVAAPDAHHAPETEVTYRPPRQRDGVVEEATEVEDPGQPAADQHDLVGLLRIGDGVAVAFGRREDHRARRVFEDRLIGGRGGLDGHHSHPPVHDAVGLGEEPMAPEVDAVALVRHRLGDSADLILGLVHDRTEVGAALQFMGGRQARRPAANDRHRLPRCTHALIQVLGPGTGLI